MNGLIAWWARNSVAANLLMLLILIAGALQFFQVEREEFPSPAFNYVTIGMSWPGAGPRDVEEQIVVRVEEALSDLDGVKSLVANAREGSANITVEMIEGGHDIDAFLAEVKNRVDAISNFPRDAFPPVVQQLKFSQNLSFITFSSTLPPREHNALARQIRDEIAALPGGTPLVDIYGMRQEEVTIEVSEEALRRYNLTFDQIGSAIRSSSINVSAGNVRTKTGSVGIAVRNLADTRSEFENIVIRQNRDGSIVRVRDIATVIDGFTDDKFIREVDNLPAVTISPKAPDKINIVSISKVIEKYIEDKQDDLPPEANLMMTYDSVESYKSQLDLVSSNALIGLGLVLIVLTLFLRPIVAVWVAAGIVSAFVGTFIFMPIVGVSLNFLSLFGLLLVIGIVVDDALIVGESIHRQNERGKDGIDGAVIGTQLVIKPVFFAVLTTIIAFAPWIFIGGGTAQFTKHIAWTVILALSFSLVESFFILPAHLAHMKKQERSGPLSRFQSSFADGIVAFAKNIYRPIISVALHMRWATVIVFFCLFLLAQQLLAQGWVKNTSFPQVEGQYFEVEIEPQEGTPYERNLQIYDRLKDAIDTTNAQFEDELGITILESRRTYATESRVGAGIIIIDGNDRPISTSEFGERLRENIGEIPDAERINVDTNSSGDENSGQIFLSLEGDSLDALAYAAEDMKDYLRTVAGLYDVRDGLLDPNDEMRFQLKPGAERFGLTLAQISSQVRGAYFGVEAQRLPRDGRDVRVMVRYPLETRESLESIDSFRIRTPDGREVPLAAVADVEFAPALSRITRIDRELSVSVRADLGVGVDQGEIFKALYSEFVPGWKLRHPDVSLKERGERQEQEEFNGRILVLGLIAVFVMYMLLAIAFGSYWQPMMIMSALPFGFMGAVFGHLITGIDYSMIFSLFGIAAAGGVVINDNLVLIDYVNRLRKEGAGAFAALVEAAVVRFRPIILTSITTFVGLLPILGETSVNAQILKPMVVSLAFGVFFALFVTLLFVPALYGVGVDIARFYRGLWTGEKQPAFGEGASRDGTIPDIDPEQISMESDTEGSLSPAE